MTDLHDIDRAEVMAFVDGEIVGDRAAVIRTHLDECDACRAYAESLRATSASLAAWDAGSAPASLDARVLDALTRGGGSGSGRAPRRWFPAWGLAGWGLAGASVAAAALAVIVVPRMWPPAPASVPTSVATTADADGRPAEPVAVTPPAQASIPADARPEARESSGGGAARLARDVATTRTMQPEAAKATAPSTPGSAEAFRNRVEAARSDASARQEAVAQTAAAPVAVPPAVMAPPPPPPSAPRPPSASLPTAADALARLGAAGGRGGAITEPRGGIAAAPPRQNVLTVESPTESPAQMPAPRYSLGLVTSLDVADLDTAREAVTALIRARNLSASWNALSAAGDPTTKAEVAIFAPIDQLEAILTEFRKLGQERAESRTRVDLASQLREISGRIAAARTADPRADVAALEAERREIEGGLTRARILLRLVKTSHR